jgi:hypothetical protein
MLVRQRVCLAEQRFQIRNLIERDLDKTRSVAH